MTHDVAYWLKLGARAMACEGFEWHAGMRIMDPPKNASPALARAEALDDLGAQWGQLVHAHDDCGEEKWVNLLAQVPDLRDPGTLGHCIAMMRKAVNHESASAVANAYGDGYGWQVNAKREIWQAADTEAEAIVNAWEGKVYRG